MPEDIAYGALYLARMNLVRDRHGARHRRGLDCAVIPLPGYSTAAVGPPDGACDARTREQKWTWRRNSPAGAHAQRVAVLAMLRADHGHPTATRVSAGGRAGVVGSHLASPKEGAARYEGRLRAQGAGDIILFDIPRRPLRPPRGKLSSRRFRLVASALPEQHS
jgi:hypothetical protein